MPSYRLYRLDGAGKIESADWLEADDVRHAAEQARALNLNCICEIWDRQRLAARIDPAKK